MIINVIDNIKTEKLSKFSQKRHENCMCFFSANRTVFFCIPPGLCLHGLP
jgi:hypothetical protein